MRNKMYFILAAVLIFQIFSAGCKEKAVEVKSDITPAASAEVPENFSANLKFMSRVRNFTGRIFSTKDKSRMEMPDSVVITRTDKNVVWVLMPGEKMFIEYPLQTKDMAAGFHKMPNEINRKLIASEMINGKKANKYEVVYAGSGGNETVYQWVADDTNVPIKTAGVDSNWSYEYDNVQISTPKPDLFDVPHDYKKFVMPSQDPSSITHY